MIDENIIFPFSMIESLDFSYLVIQSSPLSLVRISSSSAMIGPFLFTASLPHRLIANAHTKTKLTKCKYSIDVCVPMERNPN